MTNSGYNQDTRIRDLITRARWVGETTAFIELLKTLIAVMPTEPQDIRRDMTRYYIEVGGPKKKDNGRIAPEDKFFYTNLQIGRAILDTLFGMSMDDLKAFVAKKQKGHW